MTVRHQAQHRGMVDRSDRTQPGVTQRDDRRGTRVVRVGLVGPTRVEQSHPRRQRGRHINDALTGGDELLGQQHAETTDSFDVSDREVFRVSRLGLRPGSADRQF